MVFQLTIKILDREMLVGALRRRNGGRSYPAPLPADSHFATILTLVATPAMLVIGGAFERGRQPDASRPDQTGPVTYRSKRLAPAHRALAAN